MFVTDKVAVVVFLSATGLGCGHAPAPAASVPAARAPAPSTTAAPPPTCGVNIAAAEAISGITGASFCRSAVLGVEAVTEAAAAFLRARRERLAGRSRSSSRPTGRSSRRT